MTQQTIKQFQGEYRWLSNFWRVPISYKGNNYPSVEHAYMSAKSDKPEWKHFCSNKYLSPGEVKREGKKVPLKPNWEKIKRSVMKECLTLKFSQEPYKSKLLATNNSLIEEGNRWGDKYWGVDLDTGEGENHLGKLIMEVREELKL